MNVVHKLIKSIRQLVIFSLAAIVNTASAEWKPITKTYQSVGYVDVSSIQKHGDITSMNTLIDYAKPPFDGNNLSYKSLTLNSEYNCTTKQFRTLKLTSYLGNMATGQKPYSSDESSEWQAVPASTIQEGFWKTACGK